MIYPSTSYAQTASMGSSSPYSANHVEYDIVHQYGTPAMAEPLSDTSGVAYPVEDVATVATARSFPRSSPNACPETGTVRSAPQPVNPPTEYRPGYKDQARTVMASTMEHGEEVHLGGYLPGPARPSLIPHGPSGKPSLVVHAIPMADVVSPTDSPHGVVPNSQDSVDSARRKLDP
jgi:hypothetical protein